MISSAPEKQSETDETPEGSRKHSSPVKKTALVTALCLLVVILVSAGLIASKKDDQKEIVANPSSFSKTELGNGWIRYEKNGDGSHFSVELPANWETFGLDNNAVVDLSEKVEKMPKAQTQVKVPKAKELIESRLRLIGYDTQSSGSGFCTNINISQEPVPADTDYETFIKGELATVNNPPSTRIKTRSGDATRVLVENSMKNSANQEVTVIGAGFFYFIQGGGAYILVLSTKKEDYDKYVATFDRIGQSFEIGEGGHP